MKSLTDSRTTYLNTNDVFLGLVDFLLHRTDGLLRQQTHKVGKLGLVKLLVEHLLKLSLTVLLLERFNSDIQVSSLGHYLVA